jgi:hypothetical protein
VPVCATLGLRRIYGIGLVETKRSRTVTTENAVTCGDIQSTLETSINLLTPSQRALEPVERISEFLFGLIMILTVTCSFNVGKADRGSVRVMLLEALGCNVAWGIIDAFFYLLNSLGQKGQRSALLSRLRRTFEPREARRIVAEALPPYIQCRVDNTHFRSGGERQILRLTVTERGSRIKPLFNLALPGYHRET